VRPATIQLSEAAAADITDLAQWYADRSDDKLSKKWERAVTTALLRIVDFPKSGPLCRFNAIDLQEVRRMAIAGFPKHLVFYRVENDSVLILRIVHGARDLEKLL
jgi:toxin ParE1/3/4